MWRGVTFSAVLHLAVALALILELPLFNKRLEVAQPPAIDIEFADVSEVANLPKAGQESEQKPEEPVNELPPPPPPSSKAPPPPPPPSKDPVTPKAVKKTPKPPTARPPAPKKVTRKAEKTVPKRTFVKPETKVAEALDTLPVPATAPKKTKPVQKKEPPKPEPPKVDNKVAKKPEAKQPPKQKQTKVTGNSKERTKKRSFEDRMAAVVDRLNKNKPRPKDPVTDKRSRLEDLVIGKKGASRKDPVGKLTVTEKMLVRGRLSRNWTVNKGAPNADQMWVVVKFELTRNGHLTNAPRVVDVFEAGQTGRVFNAFANSALKAVQKSTPFPLPVEKYRTWRVMEVRFSLADMFG